MNQKLLVVTAAWVLSLATTLAQSTLTINYSAAIGERTIYGNLGNPVANGNSAKLGYFEPGFNVSANSANLSVLAGAWNELGSTQIRDLVGVSDGYFSDPTFASGLDVLGQKMFMWIFDTKDDLMPAGDFGNVEQFGLFSSDQGNWTLPMQALTPMTINLSSSEVNQYYWGTGDASHLYLSPVPEPGVGTLVTLGLGALLIAAKKRRVS